MRAAVMARVTGSPLAIIFRRLSPRRPSGGCGRRAEQRPRPALDPRMTTRPSESKPRLNQRTVLRTQGHSSGDFRCPAGRMDPHRRQALRATGPRRARTCVALTPLASTYAGKSAPNRTNSRSRHSEFARIQSDSPASSRPWKAHSSTIGPSTVAQQRPVHSRPTPSLLRETAQQGRERKQQSVLTFRRPAHPITATSRKRTLPEGV